jgi:hypothetical protein
MTTALISFPLTYPSLDEIRLPQPLLPRNPHFFHFMEYLAKYQMKPDSRRFGAPTTYFFRFDGSAGQFGADRENQNPRRTHER